MDAAAGQPFTSEQAQAEWQELLQGMKKRRREAASQVRSGASTALLRLLSNHIGTR